MTLDRSTCPHCGQRMLMRAGEPMSPRQADIFDMIERRGRAGINIEVLAGVICPDKSLAAAKNLLKVFVWKINERLVSGDYRIKQFERAFYVLTLNDEPIGAPFVEIEPPQPKKKKTLIRGSKPNRRSRA